MNLGNDDLWLPFEDYRIKYLKIPIPEELTFDDNELENIIYNESPSSLMEKSQQARTIMRETIEAIGQYNLPQAFGLAWVLMQKHPNMPVDVYRQMMPFLASLPALFNQLAPEEHPCSWFDLHKKLWMLGMTFNDDYMLSVVGHELQLCCERIQNVEEYRKVNEVLREIARKQYKSKEEAVRESNLGFSYMMEGNWNSAINHFEKAALMMENINELELANIRLNIVISRFGERQWVYDEDIWNAAASIGDYLKTHNDWRERKSLVCRARIKEKAGSLKEAIEFMREAVRIGETMNDMYLETDRAYLIRLENDLLETNGSR
jgi:tetratricopeptide (TPR) repeat protein